MNTVIKRPQRSLLTGDAHVLSVVRDAVAAACASLDPARDCRARWRDQAIALAVDRCGLRALDAMVLVDAYVQRDASARLLLRASGLAFHPIVFAALLEAVRAEM